MNRIVTLLAVTGLALPALAGPENDADLTPAANEFVAQATRGVDDPGDPCEAFDIQAVVNDNRILGIEYAWGYYWVTGAGLSTVGSGPEFQKIYQFDECWNLIETYPQMTTSPTWGGRDPAAIEDDNLLYIGTDNGEWATYVYDPGTERLDTSMTTSDFTFVAGTVRALAYRPSSDTFFTKDFSSGITEIDRTGFEVNFWSNPGISAYGAAYDPIAETIWFNASCAGCPTGATGPNGELVEWDPGTGSLTGRSILVTDDVYTPGGWTGWIVGGLDIRLNGDQIVFVALYQGAPGDFASILLGDGTDGCPTPDCGGGCYPDCDESGGLDFFDFLCFQN
ncbi:MAG: hypothetical protein ACF8R7_18475, partial [Phycisphaerales bacterium JB039]